MRPLFHIVSIRKTDEELAKETRNGNASAFEMLYERYHRAIYEYLWNLLNYNYDDTISLTSDTFIKGYEYIKHNEVMNVKSMFYRIAHNAAVDRMRTNQTQREQIYINDKIEEIEDRENIKNSIQKEFQVDIFKDLLGKIDIEQKELLYMYYHEGKSYEEMAELLGINKNTVGTLLFNAKKKLQLLAEKHGIKDVLSD